MSTATRTDKRSPAQRAANSHDLIRVHGARVNNLKDVSVEIPKRQLTVFTGVSGSGKSSLVFGTIAAADQRDLQRLRAGLHADAGAARR
jgi:excinuclease UvrABC ATPase subunit